MGTDDRALVTACRRLIDRHPAAGALWWTCAQLIEDRDTRSAGRRAAEVFAESIAADPVLEALALDIPVGAAVVVAPDPAGGAELAGDLRARRQDLVVVEEPDLDDPLAVAEMFPHDAAPAEGDAARPRLLVVEAAATGGDVALVLGGARAAIAGAR